MLRIAIRYTSMVDWERLEQFSDVRGIRIEDDIFDH